MIEAMKQALEALEKIDGAMPFPVGRSAITSLRQAIAKLESQDDSYCQACDGALCTAKKGCVALSNLPQRTEKNFCPRCGKRTNDIHTCTPPQIKTIDSFESAKVEDYNRGWNDCLFASGIVKQSQRTWVGLTDEEVKHEWEVWRANVPRYAGFATGIEAKLKQKNGFTEEKNT